MADTGLACACGWRSNETAERGAGDAREEGGARDARAGREGRDEREGREGRGGLGWARRNADPLFALALAFGACWAFGAFAQTALPVDDAYIHMAYGKGFRWETLLSFNGGHPDAGSSSWAWTLLCVASEQLGLHTPTVLRLLGVFSLALILKLTITLARGVVPRAVVGRRLWPYAAAVLVAANGNILWLTVCGMEAIPTVAVVMAFAHRLAVRRVIDWRVAVLALSMVWLRTETLVWLVGMPALLALTRRRVRGRFLWGLVPLAGIGLNVTYHLVVVGRLLPTTAAAKGATFVATKVDLSDAATFLYKLDRDYLGNFLEGWQLELRILAAALLVGGVALGVRLARRRMATAGWPLSDTRLAAAGLLAGALGQAAVFVLTFRTAYHHLRYFAPLLVLCAAFALPAAAVALSLVWRALERWHERLGRVAPVVVLALPLAWMFGGSLYLDAAEAPFWSKLYAKNCEQLASVHIATARWLREHRSEFARGSVASFDIGALRYFSGMQLVDLGGLLDGEVLAYRRAKDNAGLIAAERPSLYVTLDNGFDLVAQRDRLGRFTLERVTTIAYPEYLDPFPPHSKRMEIFRVNHCDEPRRVRQRVGPELGFEPGGALPEAEAEGRSFEHWPGGATAGLKALAVEGSDFLTSYGAAAHDEATGVWRGPWFTAEADYLRLLVAGGHDRQKLRVELVDDGGAVLGAWTAFRTDAFMEVLQPLEELRGRRLRLVVRDEATGPWGHISIDGVEQFDWRDAPARACPGAPTVVPRPLPPGNFTRGNRPKG